MVKVFSHVDTTKFSKLIKVKWQHILCSEQRKLHFLSILTGFIYKIKSKSEPCPSAKITQHEGVWGCEGKVPCIPDLRTT